MFKNYIKLILIILWFLDFKNATAADLKYNMVKYGETDIYLTKFNLKDFKINLIKATKKISGKDFLLNMAKDSLIAINGGYFHQDGRPVGVLKIRNQLYTLGRNSQAIIGWKNDDSQAYIDIINPDLKLLIDNNEVKIQRLNHFTRGSEVILFTDEFGDYTLTDGKRKELIINDKNELFSFNDNGGSVIKAGHIILSFPENFDLSKYKLGSKIHFEVIYKAQFNPKIRWNEMDYIVSGIPLLMKDNKINYQKFRQLKLAFSETPRARTAICLTNDNSILFAATNYIKNGGLTLVELAEFLKTQNCRDALNLDGGSSTTFVYKNKLINKMTSHDKMISNAIVVK